MRSNTEVLALLEEAGGKLVAEDDFKWSDDQTLSIPKGMTLRDAHSFLRQLISEYESETTFKREYRFRPWDGAMATHRALKRAFGMVSLSGQGWNPPQLITIPVDVNVTEQVPWGQLQIPVLPNVTFTLDATHDREMGMLFVLNAYGPRSDRHAINGVFNLVQRELETDSIYRGKAFDGQERPEFIDVSRVDRNRIVYNTDALRQLEATVWSLMRYTDTARAIGLPLKRAVLLEGPYGTGKTVGSTITAQEAIANGWTFVECRPGRDDVAECMATARLYQPSVLFVEDVDSFADPQTMGVDGATRLLDLFDGMSGKGTEMLVVMTTNHPERIHKGMLRPGRIHQVIHIGELDREALERMVRVTVAPENLALDVDFNSVAVAMDGFLPAYVRESVDRAVWYNLNRNNGTVTTISTTDLVEAANGLRPQLALMNAANESRTVDALSESFAHVMGESVGTDIQSIQNNVRRDIQTVVTDLPYMVRQSLDGIAIKDYDEDVMYRLDVDL